MSGQKIPLLVACVILALGLVTCATPTPTELIVMPEAQTVVVTIVVTPTPESTPFVVTATSEPTPLVVTRVVVATPTPAPSTETPPPTKTPHPQPRATPTSAGLLEFTHWLTGWSLISASEGEWEYTIHVEATGGSPPYVYHHDLETFNTPDITWQARGCTLNHTIQVDSADGQSVRRDYWYAAPWCPTPEP